MLLWALVILLSAHGIRLLLSAAGSGFRPGALRRSERELQLVAGLFRELQETLQAGLVPAKERWEKLRDLPRPWGALAHESIQGLRAQGGAVLPTLLRLRALAEEQREALQSARAKSSQAVAQALVCLGLVPVFGALLHGMLPGLSEEGGLWALACGAALLLSALGAAWVLHMTEEARWAGLTREERPWLLASLCAGERFLALVRSGTPPDLAWARACELLDQEAPELALRWGRSVWKEEDTGPRPRARLGTTGARARAALIEAGTGLRKSLQISLMEGRPCTERVETALAALRADLRSLIERELSLLGTRALKPLFICVAPSLLGLLAIGLAIAWSGGLESWDG